MNILRVLFLIQIISFARRVFWYATIYCRAWEQLDPRCRT